MSPCSLALVSSKIDLMCQDKNYPRSVYKTTDNHMRVARYHLSPFETT